MEGRRDIIKEAILPHPTDSRIDEIMNQLYCDKAEYLEIQARPLTKINDCHNNVAKHVSYYGGSQIKGYYVAVDNYSSGWIAIGHSVWKRGDEMIDITPVKDNRKHNLFIWNNSQETENESYIIGGIKQDVTTDTIKGFKL